MGRRILVIGAGTRVSPEADPPVGNGRAMAVLAAREGARVAAADVDADALQGTVDWLAREGHEAVALLLQANHARLDAARAAVREAAERLDPADPHTFSRAVRARVATGSCAVNAALDEFLVGLRS